MESFYRPLLLRPRSGLVSRLTSSASPALMAAEIRSRGRQRRAGALGCLHFGVDVLPCAWPPALERSFYVRELGAELGLDLLSAVELAAGTVHAAEL